MNKSTTWATIAIAIVMTGSLAGCATSAHTSGNSANTSSNSPANAVGTSQGNDVKVSSAAPSTDALTISNIASVHIESATSLSVNGHHFTPPKLTHGSSEPIVATVHFQNISVPTSVDIKDLRMHNPSSTVDGGIDYFTYDGAAYKANASLPGNLPVKDSFVLRQPTTVTLVGTIGTPTPAGVKVQLSYKGVALGSYSVTNKGTLRFKHGTVAAVSATSTASPWRSTVQEAMKYISSRSKIPLMAPTKPTYDPVPYGSQKMDAQVSASPTSYMVNLQWATKKLPINSPELKQPPNTGLADVIGGFGAKVYATSQVALANLKSPSQSLSHAYVQPPAGASGTRVSLGHGIVGTLYKSQFNPIVEWHEGEWTLQVTDMKAQDDIQEAKKLVNYFNTALLPETKGVFGVNLAGDGEHTTAHWVFGNVMYSCSDYHYALEAAKMATSMRTYPSKQPKPSAMSPVNFGVYLKFTPNSTVQISGNGPGGSSAPLGALRTDAHGWVKIPHQSGWSYVIGSGKKQVVLANLPAGPQLSGIPRYTSYVITGRPSAKSKNESQLASGVSSDGYIAIPDKPGWDISITFQVQSKRRSVEVRIPVTAHSSQN